MTVATMTASPDPLIVTVILTAFANAQPASDNPVMTTSPIAMPNEQGMTKTRSLVNNRRDV
jgi:hypothetical protein